MLYPASVDWVCLSVRLSLLICSGLHHQTHFLLKSSFYNFQMFVSNFFKCWDSVILYDSITLEVELRWDVIGWTFLWYYISEGSAPQYGRMEESWQETELVRTRWIVIVLKCLPHVFLSLIPSLVTRLGQAGQHNIPSLFWAFDLNHVYLKQIEDGW